MDGKRPPARVSIGDVGRFFVGTRRGRVLAFVCLAATAMRGLLGVLGATEFVSTVAIFVFVAIAVPIILLQAIKAIRPPHDTGSSSSGGSCPK